jgi:Ni2+-binding GTPase involved in maturation of urease and hydrogenase
MDLSESGLLTIVGMVGSGFTALLIYFLKSRCSTIKCGCISCEREVLTEVQATVHNRV